MRLEQLGHARTRMTEKHDAHLGPSYIADSIPASFPNLAIVEPSKVRSLESPTRR
jgi:hypothetical protein